MRLYSSISRFMTIIYAVFYIRAGMFTPAKGVVESIVVSVRIVRFDKNDRNVKTFKHYADIDMCVDTEMIGLITTQVPSKRYAGN